MRAKHFITVSLLIFLCGCTTRRTEEAAVFRSPQEFTGALESRWPLTSIRRFCIPERRHEPTWQPPVALMSSNWEGTLYSGSSSDFDKIAWKAVEKEGKVEVYDLYARRGEDLWIIEIGPKPGKPDVTPDFRQPKFIGSHAMPNLPAVDVAPAD
jgi:hypothetical protein